MEELIEQLVELCRRTRTYTGKRFNHLMLGKAAAKRLNFVPSFHRPALADKLEESLGKYICIELVTDFSFPKGAAIWADKPWKYWVTEMGIFDLAIGSSPKP